MRYTAPICPVGLNEKCGVVIALRRLGPVTLRADRLDLVAADEQGHARVSRQLTDGGAPEQVVLEIEGRGRLRPHDERRARSDRLPGHGQIPVGDGAGQRRIPLVFLGDVPLQHRDSNGFTALQQWGLAQRATVPRAAHTRRRPTVAAPIVHRRWFDSTATYAAAAAVSASRPESPYTPVMLATCATGSHVTWL